MSLLDELSGKVNANIEKGVSLEKSLALIEEGNYAMNLTEFTEMGFYITYLPEMFGEGKRRFLENTWYDLEREQALALNWIIQSLPEALHTNAKSLLTYTIRDLYGVKNLPEI